MIALRDAYHAGLFGRRHLANNLLAGLVVGVVALPLAMAFAIASGAKPEQGLYTAIVAGFLASIFGGGRLQISGPTGAFIAVLAGITAKHGMAGLQLATLMAGIILIVMGVVRFGSVIKYIPNTVITGFTAGIGVIIWVGQWRDFLGLHPATHGEHFHQRFVAVLQALPSVHPATTGLALLSLLLLLIAPRFTRRIPAPLVALMAATVLQDIFHFDGVATIGTAFGGIPQGLPAISIPEISLSGIVKLIGPAFTIALLGAIESLLSAVVADGMAGTRHDSNQELIGQGIANVCAPLFGGFAATGAIARTATNIRAGADSPLAGMFHAIVLLLILLLLAPWAAHIPLCVLSAILFVVAYNMSELHHFMHLARTAPRSDVAILFITFFLTVFVDIVVAVNVGVALASLMFMSRMAQAVEIHEAAPEHLEGDSTARLPRGIQIYSIDGPFFFGAAEKLQRTLDSIQQHAETLVLRMGRVPFIDSTGIEALMELIEDFHKAGSRVVLCELRPNVAEKLERAGVLDRIGRENLHASLDAWKQCNFSSKTTAETMRYSKIGQS